MWFTNLRKEFTFKEQKHMIGSVWAVAKSNAGMVKCSRVVWTPSENLSEEMTFICDQETARAMFTTPCNDLNAVLEDSVYMTEAAYC